MGRGGLDAEAGLVHGFSMRCENCGAPFDASSNDENVCAFCGAVQSRQPNVNSVGGVVDQLLKDVQSGSAMPGTAKVENVRVVNTTFSVNGTQYDSLDQLPPQFRDAVARGLAIAGQLGNNASAKASTTVAVTSNATAKAQGSVGPQNAATRRVVAWLTAAVIALIVALVGVLVAR